MGTSKTDEPILKHRFVRTEVKSYVFDDKDTNKVVGEEVTITEETFEPPAKANPNAAPNPTTTVPYIPWGSAPGKPQPWFHPGGFVPSYPMKDTVISHTNTPVGQYL